MHYVLSPTGYVFAVIWLAVLGGCVGSFLNVVIYRLPQGKSLSQPGSHCPKCGHPIRWYDNVPVLAWLWLKGRCRDCHAAISSRYPLVEAAVATMYLAAALITLPVPEASEIPGVPPTATVTRDDLCVFAMLAAWGPTLLAAALILFDGRRVPITLLAPAVATTFFAVIGMLML